MINKDIGRNDPCPCGSGKKYKRCCLNNVPPHSLGIPDELAGKLSKILEATQHSSMDDMQDFVDQLMEEQNARTVDDFHGLSPAQMHDIIYTPFEAIDSVEFIKPDTQPSDSRLLFLFQKLADNVGGEGIKLTAKGNIPPKICKSIAEEYKAFGGFSLEVLEHKINREDDFYDLEVVHILAKQSGLVRKLKGRLLMTKLGAELVAKGEWPTLYLMLFKAQVRKFNWGYGDGFPDVNFFQEAFTFTLYLLTKYGDKPRSSHFYADAFINAFPAVLEEVESSRFMPAHEAIDRYFTVRSIERFADFLGLVNTKRIKGDKLDFHNLEIRKKPLLEKMVKFKM